MKSKLAQFTQRERHRIIALCFEAGIILGIFTVAVMIGPFGTFAELALQQRAAYWAVIIVLNWLQLRTLHTLLRYWLGNQAFWRAAVGSSVAASVPATFEVLWLEAIFRPDSVSEIGFAGIYPQVLILTLAIMIPMSWFIMQRQMKRKAGQTEPATVGQPGAVFLRRVPVALGKELHALQAEDHYVRVYTAAGDDLILHRFSDALAELDGYAGMQVHRSWWVAEQGLKDVARRGRKTFLVLKDGTEVPVSRSHQTAVRAAGWLA